MNIVHIYGPYDPPLVGGIQRVLELLSQGQARDPGNSVTVLCGSVTRETWERSELGVRIVHAALARRIGAHRVSTAYGSWLRQLDPGLVHLHSPCPPAEIACLLLPRGVPLVVSHHLDVERRGWHRIYDPVYQRVLRRAARILVSAPQGVEGSVPLRRHADRCRVVPFGLEAGRLAETPASRAVTVRLRETLKSPITLFLGRLRGYKGLEVLLEAMQDVPGTLVIAGEGRRRAALEARAGALGVSARAVFAGEVRAGELAGYYRAADAFVLPSTSRAETFGLSMAEAMACGVPAVSTRLGTGTSFVNRDGETGFEVEPGSAAALGAALRRLHADPDAARRMGEAARRRAMEFSADRMLETVSGLYAEATRVS